MAAILFHEPVFSTQVEAGDKLYFYEVGTTTDLEVYTDYALAVPATQPIVADSSGQIAPVYIDGTGNDPKVVLHDSSDVEKWTCDRYPIDDLSGLIVDLDAAEAAIVVNMGDIATLEAAVDALELESVDYEERITALEGATAPLYASDFTGNQTLSTNGQYVLPGNVLIQFGRVSNNSGNTSVTFNTTFDTLYNVQVTGEHTSNSNYEDDANIGSTKSVTGFNIRSGTGPTHFNWQAIGVKDFG